MFVNVVERGVLAEQLRGGLRPDSFHAGHVVRAVAHEREVIEDLLGCHAPRLHHAVAIELGEPAARLRLENGDRTVDELEEVLIAAHDEAGTVPGLCPKRERGHDVVGLVPVDPQRGNAQLVEDLLDDRDLVLEVFRGLLARGLVLLVLLVTEGGRARIEHDREVRGGTVVEQEEERTEEPEDRARVPALGVEQRVADEGEIAPVHEAVPVEQVEGVTHAPIVPRGSSLGKAAESLQPSAGGPASTPFICGSATSMSTTSGPSAARRVPRGNS